MSEGFWSRTRGEVDVDERTVVRVGGAVLTGVVLATYLLTPLGMDQIINLAFAQQADHGGQFPSNVVETWTLRGTGYKLEMYVLYSLATLLVDYSNKAAFELTVRLWFSLFALAAIAASVLTARPTLRRYDLPTVETFLLCTLGFFTVSHWVAVQAEDTAALLVVLATGFAVSERPGLQYGAGVVLGLLFTLKGVTGVLVPVTLVAVIAVDRAPTPRVTRVVASTVVCTAVVPLAMLALVPSEIHDLIEATRFQSSFAPSPFTRAKDFVGYFLFNVEHLPALVPGAVVGAGLVGYYALARSLRALLVLGGLAAFPVALVAIQSHGFAYHYAALLPTAILVMLWGVALVRRSDRAGGHRPGLASARPFAALFVAIGLCWGLTVSPVAAVAESSSAVKHHSAEETRTTFTDLREEFSLTDEPSMLYLADGVPTYYFESESHLRYYYPLPLMKATTLNPDLRGTALHRATLRRTLAYDGEYVVLYPGWFNIGEYPEIATKLDEEYCLVAVADDVTFPLNDGPVRVELYRSTAAASCEAA